MLKVSDSNLLQLTGRRGSVLTGQAKGAMAPRVNPVSREERLRRPGLASVPSNTSTETHR